MNGTTRKFTLTTPDGDLDLYVTTVFEGVKIREALITVGKEGGTDRGLIRAWSDALSLLLANDVDFDDVYQRFVGHRFEPSGVVRGCPEVPMCTSVIDLVVRWVRAKITERERQLAPQE